MKLNQLLSCYFEDVQPTRSLRTVIRGSWPKFLAFCESQGLELVCDIHKQHVEAFCKELLWQSSSQGKLYKANSVDQFVRRVRQVLRWAYCNGWVDPDPTYGLLLPRPVQPVLKLLTWSQLQDVLAVPNQQNPIGLRDALAFQLLAETDLGIVGLVALTLESVTELELESNLKESRPALGGQGCGLFFGRDGNALSDQVVKLRLRQAAQQIGLNAGLPSRVLRKSYLAAMLGFRKLELPNGAAGKISRPGIDPPTGLATTV